MTTATELGTAIHRAIGETIDHVQAHADAIASEHGLDNATIFGMLGAAISGLLAGVEAPVAEHDGRRAQWRCRFRLYAARDMNEPAADSDADMPPDRPGAMVLSGLPAVASELVALAEAFHEGKPITGLGQVDMDRRLRGLRPTLSRRKGNATWRVPYITIENYGGQSQRREWLMRVDIIREKDAES